MNASNSNVAEASLLNLPPELRAIIYTHLFTPLSILVTKDGVLDLSNYPFQISCASRVLREETLPSLRNATESGDLELICTHGRFPYSIRRRLPSYVYTSIRRITILDELRYDELKPTISTFPNLGVLYLDLQKTLDINALSQPDNEAKAASDSNVVHFVQTTAAAEFDAILRRLHQEQEAPREGLERDYLVEDSLWLIYRRGRECRGFDMGGRWRYILMSEVNMANHGSRGPDVVKVCESKMDRYLEAVASLAAMAPTG